MMAGTSWRATRFTIPRRPSRGCDRWFPTGDISCGPAPHMPCPSNGLTKSTIPSAASRPNIVHGNDSHTTGLRRGILATTMSAETDWTIRPREGLGRLEFGMPAALVDSLSATYGTITGRGADRVADDMLRETLAMFGDAMSDAEKQAFIAEYADNGPPADSVTETRGALVLRYEADRLCEIMPAGPRHPLFLERQGRLRATRSRTTGVAGAAERRPRTLRRHRSGVRPPRDLGERVQHQRFDDRCGAAGCLRRAFPGTDGDLAKGPPSPRAGDAALRRALVADSHRPAPTAGLTSHASWSVQLFPFHLVRTLVRTHTAPTGLTQPTVGRALAVPHLPHQRGFDERHTPGVQTGKPGVER